MKLVIRLVGALVVLVGVGVAYSAWYEPAYRGSITTGERPLLFAHRGFGNLAPDNSLVGAVQALKAGVAGVDVDAQFTSDKQVVIFHDVTLERFTSGTGRVDSKTFAELAQYDLGEKYGNGTEYTDAYIASLRTFMETVTPTALLMVELKVAAVHDTGMERAVVALLSEFDAFDRVYVSAFNPVVLYRLKQLDPRVKTVFIFQDGGWDPKRVAETAEADRVSLPWYLRTEWSRRVIRKLVTPDALSINEHVDEAVIDRLIKKGWPVFLWSLNTTEAVQWGLAKQPYGIVTDEPLIAKTVLASSTNN